MESNFRNVGSVIYDDIYSFTEISFAQAMAKMAVTGQNVNRLIDCSEAVPVPVPAVRKPAT